MEAIFETLLESGYGVIILGIIIIVAILIECFSNKS